LTIHLTVDPARALRIAASLSKIVHVLSVEARTQDAQSSARTERLLTSTP
jgi:hypothetical protein